MLTIYVFIYPNAYVFSSVTTLMGLQNGCSWQTDQFYKNDVGILKCSLCISWGDHVDFLWMLALSLVGLNMLHFPCRIHVHSRSKSYLANGLFLIWSGRVIFSACLYVLFASLFHRTLFIQGHKGYCPAPLGYLCLVFYQTDL